MRKVLLSAIALGVSLTPAFAQLRVVPAGTPGSESMKYERRDVAGELPVGALMAAPKATNSAQKVTGTTWVDAATLIGSTFYDLQSNSAMGSRIVQYPNGGIAAVWTMSPGGAGGASFSDRGVGYNYYNPTTEAWGPELLDEFGIANQRVGWPEIADVDQGEFVVHHSPLRATIRPAQGSGTWNNLDQIVDDNDGANTWPRVAASAGRIHMISNGLPSPTAYNGVEAPIYYSRSDDNGRNWVVEEVPIPALSSTLGIDIIGGDAYAIYARDSIVAIVTGSAFSALVLLKSTDFGDTWDGETIYQASYLNPTGLQYVLFGDGAGGGDVGTEGPDDAMTVYIDPNGMVHTAAGRVWVQLDTLADTLTGTYYPSYDPGILYWNENMANMEVIADVFDSNEDGDTTFTSDAGLDSYGFYGAIGIWSHPQITFDAQTSRVFVTFDGGTEDFFEEYQGVEQIVRDIYTTVGYVDPETDSIVFIDRKPVNIITDLEGLVEGEDDAPGSLNEEVFVATVREVGADRKVHMVFQSDQNPGTAVQARANTTIDPDPIDFNEILYYGMDVDSVYRFLSDFLPDVVISADKPSTALPINVFPNPTPGAFTVDFSLASAATVSVQVRNLLGQVVYEAPARDYGVATHRVRLHLDDAPAGLYTCTVMVDGQAHSRKVMKQ
ncbi:MAG: T9SS type A sorting domain-containing protein [Catalinimonas sp.]